MNNMHGHGQPGQGHGSNLYGYGNAQDDFSTPFNNDGAGQQPSFSDSNSFMNSNFNTHFDQEMGADSHENLATNFFQTNGQQPWQQPQFFDPSQLGTFQGLGDSAQSQSYANPYSSHMGAFSDLHESSSFPGFSQPSFENRPRTQNTMDTINPHAIRTSTDFVYQQPATAAGQESATNISQPQPQVIDIAEDVSPQQTEPEGPQLRFLDTDLTQAIDSAIPQLEKDGWLSIRPRAQFKAPAEIMPLPDLPFLNISREIFDNAEARVVPPSRRIFWSVSQLESKLRSTPVEGRDPKIKNLLQSKVSKAKTRTKQTKTKQRKTVSVAGSAVAGPKTVVAVTEEVTDDDSSTGASDNESEYISDSDEFIEEEPSPLPSSRPDDPVQAQEYDALKAVWARPAVRIGPDDVKRRLAAYLDIVKSIRAAWRAASSTPEVAALRKRFENVLRLTTKHGHHNFIESLDQLTPLASVIAAGVVELVKSSLWDDSLLEAILELVIKIPNIDPEFLKTTRLDRSKDKICKRAKGRNKDLASLIQVPSEAQAASTASTKPTPSVDSKPMPTPLSTPMSRVGSLQSQPLKKPAESSQATISKKISGPGIDHKKAASSLVAAKRAPLVSIGRPSSISSASSSGSKPAAATKPGAIKPGEKAPVNFANGTAAKPIVRQITATKTPSMFSALTAAKKPGTSINTAAKPAAAAPAPATKPKTPEPKAAAPPVPKKSAFSFADTLANLGKPKEAPKKTESKEQRAPETEEERRKRLRKEERRKLRVTWKSDSELCAVRIFDHGQDDETMHDAMEVADAADLKSEGQAFKRQLRRDTVSGVQSEDEEEQEYIEWYEPKLTDFTSIYERKPGDMDPPPHNVETRADGPVKFTSAESEAQQIREQGVMIELYNALRDIPPCPKEPANPFTGKDVSQYDFGAIKNCGANYPVPARLDDRNQQLLRQYGQRTNPAPEQIAQPSTDISSLLAMLGQSQQQPQSQPAQQQYNPQQAANPYPPLLAQFGGAQAQAPAAQAASNPYQDAINLFNSLQGGSQAPAAPLPSIPQPTPPQPPQASGGNPDLSSILASLAAGSGQTQTPPPPAPIPPPQPPAPTNGAPAGVDPSLLGWLAQYHAASTGNSQAQPQQPQNQQASWPAFGNTSTPQLGTADWMQQLSAQNNGTQGGNNDRKRAFDDDGKGDARKKPKSFYNGVPYLPCRYYKEGRCQKGADCTFLHE